MYQYSAYLENIINVEKLLQGESPEEQIEQGEEEIISIAQSKGINIPHG